MYLNRIIKPNKVKIIGLQNKTLLSQSLLYTCLNFDLDTLTFWKIEFCNNSFSNIKLSQLFKNMVSKYI